jgi:hypothetical protein
MLGDNVYRPTERDLVTSGAAPRRLNFRTTSSLAAASVATDGPTVPTDEVWCIQQLYAQCTPGAAQTVQTMVISLILQGVQFNELVSTTENFSATAAIVQTRSWTTEFFMMPGEILRLTSAFNAGAASNLVLMNAVGIALPRGNLIR